MRIRQYCYFSMTSLDRSAAEMSSALGVTPDEVMVQGSKQTAPRLVPVAHGWQVNCASPGLRVSEQLRAVVARLTPLVDQIGWYVDDLRSHGVDVSTRLQIVRSFDDDSGEEEELTHVVVGDRAIRKLGGQHQLLGWHLDEQLIDFLVRTRAELDVDEYG